MDLLRHIENRAAPFVLVATGALLVWAVGVAGDLGPLLDESGKFSAVARATSFRTVAGAS